MNDSLTIALKQQQQLIAETSDPVERAQLAIELVEWLRNSMNKCAVLRRDSVRYLYFDQGWKLNQIALRLGLSVQRAQQLVTGVGARARSKRDR